MKAHNIIAPLLEISPYTSAQNPDPDIPHCSQACLAKYTIEECAAENFECVCQSDLYIDSLLSGKPGTCTYQSCHYDEERRQFLRVLKTTCEQIDRNLTKVPQRWERYLVVSTSVVLTSTFGTEGGSMATVFGDTTITSSIESTPVSEPIWTFTTSVLSDSSSSMILPSTTNKSRSTTHDIPPPVLSPGAIAGVVIAVVVLLFIIIATIYVVMVSRTPKKKSDLSAEQNTEKVSHCQEMDAGENRILEMGESHVRYELDDTSISIA